MIAAALTMAAFGAAAVTTNRVTVTSDSGSSMTYGSLAYCICASQSSKCAFYFTGSNVYYGSRMGELWEADFTQVNDPSTVIGSTVREKTVRGVQQAYYDLQVNLPPAPPVT